MATPEERSTVRALIPDLGTPPLFSDAQIDVFFTLGGSVFYAAAMALEAQGSAMLLEGGDIRTDDLQISDTAAAKALFARAQTLKAQGDDASEDSDVLYVYPFGSAVPDVAEAMPYWRYV